MLYDIYYNDNCLSATEGHEFYVDGEWVSAENLKVGQILTTANGEKFVIDNIVKREVENLDVYNLNVNSTHTYYVGEEEILTHNNCLKNPNVQFADSNNYVDSSLKNVVKQASDNVKQAYAARGESTKGIFKWAKVRKDIWKEVGRILQENKNYKVLENIKNLRDVIDNGKAPIMNVNGVDVRMQLHHVVSKANDIFRVVPMTPQNHILFHKTYGYYYIKPKLPWIMFDGLPRI